MITINLSVGSRYKINRKKLKAHAAKVLGEHGIANAMLDISIVGKRKIKELNESKLNHSGTTDVLSFPQHERGELDDFPLPSHLPPHLGDIVISFPEAVSQAQKFGKLVDDQINFYLEHALLHLLGYHHE